MKIYNIKVILYIAYDVRRNLNFIGKASLIQIICLEDIQVFSNKEYDDKFIIK